ncbi:uncharacterized protein LOC129961006 [Argiope bruennichi]|uniref:Secreted protein n=1 Tax=Argiope bruennichi TaxID=94029 RepID=A0A8T0FHC7_ARGBR|nr:uncharacterized protein LOC129961006 [Argiope bruennichi]KAF8790376.1 hypothetical protein HNY73_005403 [Argiope bruennichi]
MMWTVVVVLSSLLAILIASSGTKLVNGEKKFMCQLQEDNNLECNLRQMLIGRKIYDSIRENENTANSIKPPLFICKGPSCIMKFMKGHQNTKRTGSNEEKETTFYSGW